MNSRLSFLICLILFSQVNLLAKKAPTGSTENNHPILTREAKMHRPDQQVKPLLDADQVKNFVLGYLSLDQQLELALIDEQESILGTHYLFEQQIATIPVYYAQVRVNLDKSGQITSILENLYDPLIALKLPIQIDKAVAQFDLFQPEAHREQVSKTMFFNGVALEPAVVVRWHAHEIGEFETVLSADGTVLFEHSLRRYLSACKHQHLALETDTNAQVWVFNPDPLTEAEVFYGHPYVHENNQNTAVLDPLRVQRSAMVEFSSGIFQLRNPWIRIVDFESPRLPVVTSAVPAFNYSRNHEGFEQTNVLYHVTSFQLHLQRLGFQIAQFQIEVDAQGVQGTDNSYFTSSPYPRMSFGPGGVPDGEDADVIYHEYTHALFHSAAPGTSFGNERRSLEEAHADYFATSYSKSIKMHNADRMFSWDGHNEFWPGRWATNHQNKNYNNLTNFGNIYSHTDIWVASVMQVWDRLGRDCTDQIATQAMYGAAANMTMRQFAILMVDAWALCWWGAREQIIDGMLTYGVLPAWISDGGPWDVEMARIEVLNTTGFATGAALDLILPDVGSHQVTLQDMSGRVLNTWTAMGRQPFQISGVPYPAGVYLLTVLPPSGMPAVFKIARH
jgi:zinc metalloprotease ZmpB